MRVQREIADVAHRMRVQRVSLCRRVEEDGPESVEGDFAIQIISPSLDDFYRSIEEGPDPLCLSEGVLVAGGKDGPRGASPHSIHVCQPDHSVALRRKE